MSYYHFSQNNSGGSFFGHTDIWIDAPDADTANERALEHGIYFNGCDDGRDCPCCGDRWYQQWSDDEGTEVPELYGKPLSEVESSWYRSEGLVVHADGTTEVVTFT